MKIHKLFLLILLLFTMNGVVLAQNKKPKITIEVFGNVVDKESRKKLVGVSILNLNNDLSYVSDKKGDFRFKLKSASTVTLSFSYIGYQTFYLNVDPYNFSGPITVILSKGVVELDEVIFIDNGEANVNSTDVGKNLLTVKAISELPTMVGAVDVLKSMSLLPGVSSVGESSSGFNVRGGGFDQNLVLLGGTTIYNPYHLFGFLSSINADLVKDVSMYKGVVPTNYGGRASSVVDVTYKSANRTEWKRKIGVGTYSTSASIEGPIIKDKLAVIMAGRISYVNWLLEATKDPALANSSADFYDFNGKIDYSISEKSQLSYSYYISNDNFQLASDTTNGWRNQLHNLTWQHSFTDQFDLKVSANKSDYSFSILNESGVNDFNLDSEIDDITLNGKLDYKRDKSKYTVGLEWKQLNIQPGIMRGLPGTVDEFLVEVEPEQSRELALFFYNNHSLGSKIELSYGVRYTNYNYLGPREVNQYEAIYPRSENSVVGTIQYSDGEVIKNYQTFAPRIGARYSITPSFSFKAGFNRMFQFAHLISNTASISPTNIWKLSDQYLAPQSVDQILGGFFKNFNHNTIEVSVEGYYKAINNVIDYKDGAELVLKNNIETELLVGQGRAYGVEFLLKKKSGKWTGWVAYTYSRSQRLIESPFIENQINKGQWYSSNYDKPHDLTLVSNLKLRENVKLSSVFNYSTGRPVTLPIAKFNYFNQEVAYFGNRNEDRIPSYHRLDLSLTFNFITSRTILSGEWVVAIYNVYGRKNAYSVFLDDVEGSPPQAYKLSILNSPLPSLTYTLKF